MTHPATFTSGEYCAARSGKVSRFSNAIMHFILTGMISISTLAIAGQDMQPVITAKNKVNNFRSLNEYDSALFYCNLIDSAFKNMLTPNQILQNHLEVCEILIQKGDKNTLESRLNGVETEILSLKDTDSVTLASYFQVKGAYFQTLQQDTARYFLERSIALREKSSGKNDTLLHYAWNKLGNFYFNKGNFKEAVKCHQVALEISKSKLDPNNIQTATSYQNLAMCLHMLGDYTQAEKLFLMSLNINESIFKAGNPYMAIIYINLGKFYNDLSIYDLAIKYFDNAEHLILNNQSIDLNNLLVAVYWNKGNIFTHKGDYEKAITYLTKANSLFDNTSSIQLNRSAVLMDLGLSFEAKGDYSQATYYYLESAKNHEVSSVVKSYRNLGNLYFKMEIFDSAQIYIRYAMDYTVKFFGASSYDMALCYKYYGEVLSQTHSDSTIFYLSKALELMSTLFDDYNRDVARVRYLIGNHLLDQKKYGKSLQIIQEAIDGLLAGHPEAINTAEDASQIPQDIFLPDALNLKAKALFTRYLSLNDSRDLESGLNTIRFALSVIELIRTTYHDEESQIILNNNARVTVDLGLRIASELFKATGNIKYLEEAFQYSEKGKAIILLSALRGLEAKSLVNIPEPLLRKEDSLYQEIATCNNLIYNEKQRLSPNQDKLKLLNDKLFSLSRASEILLQEFQLNYPDYYKLKYDYSIVSFTGLLNSIHPDQALLEYHFADSLLYGFIFSNSEVRLVELCKSSEILDKLLQLKERFEGQDYFNAGLDEYHQMVTLCSDLYKMLIGPFEEMIVSKRLLIIPDAELGYLAFDLLLKEIPDTEKLNYKGLPWLIRNHAISYSSSATIYFEQSSQAEKDLTSRNLIAFAPSYNYVRTVRNGTEDDTLAFNLLPILGTEEEVKSISEIYKTRRLFDSRASEENFKKMAPDYRILHLAMHTVIDNQQPLYSKLVFTKSDKSSPEDGYLNTFELFNLRLRGELAVLSACNTGTGKLERGEGIISLARGFFYSGIPSVVMTLWEIEDHSSADLMEMFYRNLKKGLEKDIALQQAKIDYLDQTDHLHAHPYFWAGFVSIGKTTPISSVSSPFRSNALIYSVISLLLITFGIFVIRKRVYFHKKRH